MWLVVMPRAVWPSLGTMRFSILRRAVVDGAKVRVSSDEVVAPSAVRYAWGNDPKANMVNGQGMLASPFRTDEFVFVAATVPGIPEGTTSFEGAEAGGFEDLVTAGGRWIAEKGHAEVNAKFAHRGRQCLHIRGGDERRVEFVPTRSEQAWGQLSFQAERWTMRKPFSFRVEARVAGAWSEIYDGDREIRVGARFLSAVAIPVPVGAERFRLTCSAPEGGGILIDDVRLAPAKKMEVKVEQSWPVVPVLIGKADNPALKIRFDADGSLEAKTVTAIQLSPAGTDRLEDIKSVRVSVGGKAFGEPSAPRVAMNFSGEYELRDGVNDFLVMIELAEGASLDRRVKVVAAEVKLDAVVREPGVPEGDGRLRTGVALRQRGQDDSDAYRIPGLATTNAGTLIAVYDNRYRGGGDLPGDIDVGMSRSTDGGQSWEPMRVIMDMGDDPKWSYDGIGDPAVLVDRETGVIWVAATWSHGERSWHGSGPGLEPEETGQLMLAKSEDDGLTWSAPVNITKQVKTPEWRFVLQGPGKGITMRDGTLVFPAQFRGKNEAPVGGKPFSTLIYSRDRGVTWTIGEGVKIDTTEAQLVELDDGSIMINCRDNRGGSRSVYTTKDLGANVGRACE